MKRKKRCAAGSFSRWIVGDGGANSSPGGWSCTLALSDRLELPGMRRSFKNRDHSIYATFIFTAQMSGTRGDVVAAYRNLYKASLRCIRYSSPARHSLRHILRSAFREEPASSYSERRVSNTLKFLEDATVNSGIEHRIVKNILVVRYWRNRDGKTPGL